MTHKSLLAITIAALLSGTAMASDSETAQALEAIKAENAQLRDRLNAIEKNIEDDKKSETEVSHGTLKAKTKDSKFTINGRLMFDWDEFDGANNVSNGGHSASQSEIRRARIAVTSQLNNDWKSKLQINFDQKNQADIKDAYIQHKGQNATFTIGNHHEPMGMEELTSSKYISTIERSMVTDAFAPSRSFGMSLKGGDKHFMWAGGVFKNGNDSINTKDQTYAFTGRLAYAPINEDGHLLHLGVAASLRDMGGNDFKIKERAEVHTADKVVTSGTTAAKDMTLVSLEAAMVNGPFSAQAEYYDAQVNAQTGTDASYDGYYVLGSYFVTGESRPYKHGSFGKVKPKSDSGAWELVAKYSVLNASDKGTGVDATNIVLGVNYYLNTNMRLMADYVNTDLKSSQVLAEDKGNALSVRFQYFF